MCKGWDMVLARETVRDGDGNCVCFFGRSYEAHHQSPPANVALGKWLVRAVAV